MSLRILLTGVAWDRVGMVGSNLLKHLNSKGHRVIDFSGDILSPLDWKAFEDTPLDLVIHLAAKPGVLESLEYPDLYWDVNVHGTTRALDFCQSKGIPIMYASSSNAYEWWLNPYASTKKACEAVAKSYTIPTLGMRFHTVWPGRDDMLFKKIQAGKVVKVNASHTRDFIHIEDLCEAIETIAIYLDALVGGSLPMHRVVDIGTGKEYSVAEVYKKYAKKPDAIFVYSEESRHERIHTKADVRYLYDMGWEPKKDILEYGGPL